jgi:hypothetical protein
MKKNGTATEVSNPEPGASRVTPDLSPWPDANGQLLEGWARCNTAVLEGAIELAQDILTLTQARVRADFDAWKALTDCRNPSDFLDHQKAFAEKATAQYLDEASKIQSKMTGILSKATTQFPKQDTAT